ncbi:hypothetical protein [Haladaptatus sp. W1]|uniref:hypothetical protein n=1 Tax=Haladaptatus sp. W1 TaxID=1897478 RepID=UPI001112DA35|nr:hypothetical protein [Haladaptatus sp. W1]
MEEKIDIIGSFDLGQFSAILAPNSNEPALFVPPIIHENSPELETVPERKFPSSRLGGAG